MPSMDFTPARRYRYRKGALFLGRSTVLGRATGIRTERHALTIAGSRSGKGAALIIPNLLRWPHNALVIDPKGEAARATWKHRKRKLGQQVVVLDPFRVSKISDESVFGAFNPLAAIDTASSSVREDIRVLADGLVRRHDPSAAHWDNGALDVLAGIMALVLAAEPPERHSLVRVRELVASNKISQIAKAMDGRSEFGNLMTGAAGRLLRTGKEASHFLSGATANTEWLDSEVMPDLIGRSTFELADIRTKPLTVYLVLPPDYLDEHGRFLRLFVRAALSAMAKHDDGRKCLFLLDEFFSLGRLDTIAKAAGLMPGYGVHLWPFLQDYGQLEDLYGREGTGTFFGNSDAQIFFGNTDPPTLKLVSEMIGTRHEAGRWNTDEDMIGKPLMSTREVRAHIAKKDEHSVARRMIVFAKGDDILSLKLAPYFEK